MAGVKGRSGGARPGAGRKPKPRGPAAMTAAKPVQLEQQQPVAPQVQAKPQPGAKPHIGETASAREFLAQVRNDPSVDLKLRLRAAIAEARASQDGGKKEEAAGRAQKAGGGKFAPAAPPLRVVGGRA